MNSWELCWCFFLIHMRRLSSTLHVHPLHVLTLSLNPLFCGCVIVYNWLQVSRISTCCWRWKLLGAEPTGFVTSWQRGGYAIHSFVEINSNYISLLVLLTLLVESYMHGEGGISDLPLSSGDVQVSYDFRMKIKAVFIRIATKGLYIFPNVLSPWHT